jgi:hypothetical protein
MCVYSMVLDHYRPIFDPILPTQGPTEVNWAQIFTGFTAEEVAALRLLVKDFNAAVKAAIAVDKLTKQPDCEDPEKAKLVDRVKLLELRLDALTTPVRKAKKRGRVRK